VVLAYVNDIVRVSENFASMGLHELDEQGVLEPDAGAE
jgi:hypothetical protein